MRCTASIGLIALALASGCPGGGNSEPVAPKRTPDPVAKPAVDPYRDKIDALVGPLIGGEWMAGVSIGVIADADVRFYGFGRLAASDQHAPDADTIFEIGSVTKVFTSLALADAVGRMELDLEHPVAMYMPEGSVVPAFEGAQITLEQLAVHSSGLPRMPGNFKPMDPSNPFADYTDDDLYADLASHKLARAPAAKYEYSNLAMGLLGHLLELRAGKSFEALVIERVCVPLGLKDTFVTLDDHRAGRLAHGHDGEGRQVKGWDIPTLAGAGALRSTTRDMAAFVRANLAADHRELGPAMKLTHESRMATGEGGGSVGLGWHIESGGTRWHNGQTGGYHSYIAFDAKRGTGVVVLTNTATPLGDVLGVALMLMLADQPYEIRLPTTVALSEDVLQGYVGTYRLASDFIISVSREGDRLYAQATGWPGFRLYASSKTEFYLRVVEAQIVFEVGDDGRAKALVLRQGGQEFKGPRL